MGPITCEGQEPWTERQGHSSACSPPALGTMRGWGHSWGHLPGCWHGQEKINGFVVLGHITELWLLPGHLPFWQERACGFQSRIQSPSTLADGVNHPAAVRTGISRPFPCTDET